MLGRSEHSTEHRERWARVVGRYIQSKLRVFDVNDNAFYYLGKLIKEALFSRWSIGRRLSLVVEMTMWMDEVYRCTMDLEQFARRVYGKISIERHSYSNWWYLHQFIGWVQRGKAFVKVRARDERGRKKWG